METSSSIFRGTDASMRNKGLAGLCFIHLITSDDEIIDLPLVVEVMITSKNGALILEILQKLKQNHHTFQLVHQVFSD